MHNNYFYGMKIHVSGDIVVVGVFSQHFCWHGPLDRPVGGFLRYQSVGTATGPTALCGIRTTPRIEILSPEIQPSDPLVE